MKTLMRRRITHCRTNRENWNVQSSRGRSSVGSQSSMARDLESWARAACQGKSQKARAVWTLSPNAGQFHHRKVRLEPLGVELTNISGPKILSLNPSRWACLSLIMRAESDVRSPGCSLERRVRSTTATVRRAVRDGELRVRAH